VNVYIVVEVAARELEARLLLALVAAARGHDVLLGEVDPRTAPEALPAGLFHDKSLTPGQEMRRQVELAERGHLISSQDEEHGLLQPDYGLFMERRFAPAALDVAARVLTWGPHDHAALTDGRPRHVERLRMTGSPRVDLWRPEFAVHHRREPLPDVTGPYVLFANNFTHLLGMNRFTTMVADKRGKYFEGTDDPLERQWFVEMTSQAERLHHVVASIRLLARSSPDLTVVVRPHPIESPAAWRDLIGPIPNVLVTKQGSISPWVRSAVAVVHTGDTTGFEGAVSGVPLVSLEPTEGIAVDLGHVTGRLGIRVENARDVVAAVRAIRDGEDVRALMQPDAPAVLDARLAAVTGRFASERIVDAWEELTVPAVPRMRPDRLRPGPFRVVEARARSVVRPAVHAVREVRRRLRDGADRDLFVTGHKFPPIDHTALERTAASLLATLGLSGTVDVRPIGPRLVHVAPRSRP
jgi:surface carbohydrate biosynthesis protein